ncbi:MAG: DNA adenine methylase [Thiomargarita sp.]|nr:DNA adenine methylase [Thiomargarita sp.]
MCTIKAIAKEFYVREDEIEYFITSNHIILKDNNKEKLVQQLLPFIEAKNNRVFSKLTKSNFSFTYRDNKILIYKDDAISFLKKIPSNSVDIIATDPAYSGMNTKLKLGKGRIVGKYSEKGTTNGKWFGEFEDSEENYINFLTECKRVLKKSTGHIYIMFDSYSLLSLGGIVRNYFDVKNLITWDKINIGMGHYYRRRHEYILFGTNGNTRKIKNRTFPDVWRFKRIHNSKYPTQKPVEVFQAMIHASANDNFTVCDPFLGSGSSIIAAIKNNCKFIGCDISDKSMEISKNRIRQYLNNNTDILQLKTSAVDDKIFWE